MKKNHETTIINVLLVTSLAVGTFAPMAINVIEKKKLERGESVSQPLMGLDGPEIFVPEPTPEPDTWFTPIKAEFDAMLEILE